ncbi:ribose-phosphate pyrophosphokinase [Candidatus Uhrbacteria bacterium]|nr:ribose-phosphate pyrophosphokinase [Candidatus Uhrbacteria bacterium]
MIVYTLPDPTSCEQYIRDHVSTDLSESAVWKTFPSGEFYVRLLRVEKKVVIVGRTWGSADNLWRTLLLVHTAKQNGAEHIILVLPYFAYSRQDRQRLEGEPFSGALLAQLFASSGARQIISIDLHSKRIQDASPIPLASISFVEELASVFKKEPNIPQDVTVVAPDKGAKDHSDTFASLLQEDKKCVWIEKERDPHTGKVQYRAFHGADHNGSAVLLDDMLDTGGTIQESVRVLRQRGFQDISLCITHPIFSGDAADRIRALGFSHIFVSDTIPLSQSVAALPGIHVISAGQVLVNAISRYLHM